MILLLYIFILSITCMKTPMCTQKMRTLILKTNINMIIRREKKIIIKNRIQYSRQKPVQSQKNNVQRYVADFEQVLAGWEYSELDQTQPTKTCSKSEKGYSNLNHFLSGGRVQ